MKSINQRVVIFGAAAVTTVAAITVIVGVVTNKAHDTNATPTTSEAPAAPTAEFPRSGLQTYEAPEQIVSDLSSGLVCNNFHRDTGGRYAASSGRCSVELTDDSSQEIVVMIFSSDVNKQSQVSLFREMGKAINYGFVEGGNWLVNCGTIPVCEAVAKTLGGRTETLPVVAG